MGSKLLPLATLPISSRLSVTVINRDERHTFIFPCKINSGLMAFRHTPREPTSLSWWRQHNDFEEYSEDFIGTDCPDPRGVADLFIYDVQGHQIVYIYPTYHGISWIAFTSRLASNLQIPGIRVSGKLSTSTFPELRSSLDGWLYQQVMRRQVRGISSLNTAAGLMHILQP